MQVLGVDRVGIATNDMFSEELIVAVVTAKADIYNDDGYMINAFNRGATDSGMMARILPAITDELWKRGYSNDDLAKIYGGNKMRVYQQVGEGVPEGKWDHEYAERVKLRKEFMERYGTR